MDTHGPTAPRCPLVQVVLLSDLDLVGRALWIRLLTACPHELPQILDAYEARLERYARRWPAALPRLTATPGGGRGRRLPGGGRGRPSRSVRLSRGCAASWRASRSASGRSWTSTRGCAPRRRWPGTSSCVRPASTRSARVVPPKSADSKAPVKLAFNSSRVTVCCRRRRRTVSSRTRTPLSPLQPEDAVSVPPQDELRAVPGDLEAERSRRLVRPPCRRCARSAPPPPRRACVTSGLARAGRAPSWRARSKTTP